MEQQDQEGDLNVIIEKFMDSCHAFCSALTRDEVETFLSFTTLQSLKPKTVAAEIGEVTNEFYLVLDGIVRLTQEQQNTEIEVGRMGKGALVGEMSFFDRQPRTVRLSAHDHGARLLVINRPMYQRLTIEHPFIAVNLLEFVILSLDKLFRTTSQDISDMHTQISARE